MQKINVAILIIALIAIFSILFLGMLDIQTKILAQEQEKQQMKFQARHEYEIIEHALSPEQAGALTTKMLKQGYEMVVSEKDVFKDGFKVRGVDYDRVKKK